MWTRLSRSEPFGFVNSLKAASITAQSLLKGDDKGMTFRRRSHDTRAPAVLYGRSREQSTYAGVRHRCRFKKHPYESLLACRLLLWSAVANCSLSGRMHTHALLEWRKPRTWPGGVSPRSDAGHGRLA